MENGVINFDIIKEETLLGIIIMETRTLEQLLDLWKPKPKTNLEEDTKKQT